MGKKSKKEQASAGDDELLQAYVAQADKKHKASVEAVKGTISPRANAAAMLSSDGRFWIHGGECFSGDTTTTFDELMYYDTAAKPQPGAAKWFAVAPAGKAKPRARNGHQGVATASALFIHGGEYTSKDGIDISHLGDLWRLDLEHLRWNEMVTVAAPSARSGHRMAAVDDKSFVIFGGYYDTGRGKARKFNDLFHFTVDGETLQSKQVKANGDKPSPRSGCCLAATNNMACVYGGVNAAEKALQDMWILPLQTDNPTWRSVAFTSNGLNPRMGLSMTVVKSAKGEDMPTFFGGLEEFRDAGDAKKKKKKQVKLHNDLWMLEAGSQAFRTAAVADESAACPVPRMSAAVGSHAGDFFVFGGVIEVAAGQQTLGDLWRATTKPDGSVSWRNLDKGAKVLGCDDEDDSESTVDGEDAQIDGAELPEGVDPPRRLQELSPAEVSDINSCMYASMNDTGKHETFVKVVSKHYADNGGAVPTAVVGKGAAMTTLLAAKCCGAKKVVGFDGGDERRIALSNDLLRDNDVLSTEAGSQVCVESSEDANMMLKAFDTDKKVLLLHEAMGTLMLGSNAFQELQQAKNSFEGRVLDVFPRVGIQYAVLIECPELTQVSDVSTAVEQKFNVNLQSWRTAKDTCFLKQSRMCAVDLGTTAFKELSEKIEITRVDFLKDKADAAKIESELPVKITHSGTATALLFYWVAGDEAMERSFSTYPGEGGAPRAQSYGWCYQLTEALSAGSPLPVDLKVNSGDTFTLLSTYAHDFSTIHCQVLAE
ncbi:Protein arginine N-methyltransferase 7 [Diplonema papillatum]|nr:Protein arginine N-methyltransferase 7 [Diplonema papillatum]